MKPQFALALAAVVIAGAPGVASAQAAEPIASTPTENTYYAPLKPLVDALNQDASLKDSKITLQIDDGVILLTGVTPTEEQALRAREVVVANSGEGPVVNLIQPERIKYRTWEQVPG